MLVVAIRKIGKKRKRNMGIKRIFRTENRFNYRFRMGCGVGGGGNCVIGAKTEAER